MTDAGLLAGRDPAGLPGAGVAWLDRLREDGARRFAGLGLPTRRIEDWKYTDLRSLAANPFGDAAAPDGVVVPDGGLGDTHRAVFVNGRFDASLSDLDGLPDGVLAMSLTLALDERAAALRPYLGRIAGLGRKHFAALNTAWMRDGFALSIPEGVTIGKTIELVFVGAPGESRAAWHPRNLTVLGPGAAATLVERHVGDGAYLANSVAEIVLDADARLSHYKIQDESTDAFHVATSEVAVSARALYEGFALSTGAATARGQIAVELRAEGASCRLNGAYLGRGGQQLDTTILIDHAAPGCASGAVYKGVLDDRAKGVFQGRVTVRKDAQRTDGHQSHKALLLSDRAEVDAKPELEIYADDVRCGHGATAGELDEDALFYLRARGVPLETARGLLIDAFVEEAIEEIRHEAVRDLFRARAAAWRGGETA